MDKTYQPQQIEQHWYAIWEQGKYFSPDNFPLNDYSPGHLSSNSPASAIDSSNDSSNHFSATSTPSEPSSDKTDTSYHDNHYCIMIPPPNVTGSLHMGHAFQCTLMDTLIRYQRMLGKKVLWQVGTDHAGIATQMVVERQLQAQGKNRHDLGRDKFIEQVWQWKKTSGDTITRQLRRMGASVDWSTERFTMDEGFSHAVQEVFIRLYNEGLIYRGKRLVNWDPVLHTAISDLEVINQEEEGFMYYINYALADQPNQFITIATTRPETILADAAIAVHPEDQRYQQLIGKQAKIPCTNRYIPIIADTYVDPAFGTGCLKVTPAHDFNDYAVGQRHQLAMINILTPDAKLNDQVPAAYQGLDRFIARDQIITELKQQGLLAKTEPHQLKRPRGDRSGTVIEPYLTDQWFVQVEALAAQAKAVVDNQQIQFIPENWVNTYNAWMNNLQDWCISRQLWWGHRIPAWYDTAGNIYVGSNEAEIRAKHQLSADTPLTQDQDVLDTWFSSALWTFATLGWPENTERLKTFHPTNVLVTGFDIIFFWVARMIMLTLKFTGQLPFKQVYIHGLVRDAEGQKMSKSKGNILDPIDLIDGISLNDLLAKRTTNLMQPEKAEAIKKATIKHFPDGIAAYGTDALRFTFCSLANTGRDIKFDMGRIEGYRNFCNKLWNAARFVLMHLPENFHYQTPHFNQLASTERWIIGQLQQTIKLLKEYLETYRFDLSSQLIYDFIWHDFCDWYLELVKVKLMDKELSQQDKIPYLHVLIHVLDYSLRIAHPFIPFITEEIWQHLNKIPGFQNNNQPQAITTTKHSSPTQTTIMYAAYPDYDSGCIDQQAIEEIHWLKAVITGIRNIRGEMDISPAKKLMIYWTKGSNTDQQYLNKFTICIHQLARCQEILYKNALTEPCASYIINQLELHIPLAQLIDDPQAEITRLEKNLAKIQKDISFLAAKLNNQDFLAKAPQNIVDKEQEKLKENQQMQQKLEEKLKHLAALKKPA